MAYQAFNNFRAKLASAISSSATSLTVEAGKGGGAPLGIGNYSYFTLENAPLDREIVKVTARAGDVFTIERAADGTTARAWAAGDIVSCRPNVAAFMDTLAQWMAAGVAGGTVDTITATLGIGSLTNGMSVMVQALGANTSTAPTLNFDSTGAKTIVWGSNYQLAVGDIPGADYPCHFQYDASLDKWVLLNPAVPRGHGECTIARVSSTQMRLERFGGRWLRIGGVPREIPIAGVTKANSGLAANTGYYIYAFWTGSAIDLEFSTTGRETHVDGVEIKIGDATRTLIGLVGTNPSSQFDDGMWRPWFNRRRFTVTRGFPSSQTISGVSTFTEVNSGIRCQFQAWAGECVSISYTGSLQNSLSGATFSYGGLALKQTMPPVAIDTLAGWVKVQSLNAGAPAPINMSHSSHLTSDGFWAATVMSAVNAGVATWLSTGEAGAGGSGSLLQVVIG